MGYFLVEGTFAASAAKALIKSPSDRSVIAKSLVESMGGTFHHYFFTSGTSGYVVLCELPDEMRVAALDLALCASGAFSTSKTRGLLTPEEGKAVMILAQDAEYAPPGIVLSA